MVARNIYRILAWQRARQLEPESDDEIYAPSIVIDDIMFHAGPHKQDCSSMSDNVES